MAQAHPRAEESEEKHGAGRASQFIAGFPRSISERQKSRSAIKSNASRHRWRKRNEIQRKALTGPEILEEDAGGLSSSVKLAHRKRVNTLASFQPVQSFQWLEPGDVESFDFSRTLHLLTLPPAFPVDGGDLIPVERMGKVLQAIRDVHDQVFPTNSHGKSVWANAWMQSIVQSGAVFYAHAFSQMIREVASDAFTSARLKHVALTFHANAVNIIKDNMSQPSTACSDENILAVFALAQHQMIGNNHQLEHKPLQHGPKQGPLRSLRLLDLYGGPIRSASMHQEGLARMLAVRGGIQELELPGLKQQMCYAEVILASRQVAVPRCQFFPFLELDFAASLAANRRVEHPLRAMGTGFDVFRFNDPDTWHTHLRLALDNLALYSLGVDDYVAGRSLKRSLSVIGEQRLFVQHGLLCLTILHSTGASPLCRICHFAGIIYSFLCVFPIPEASFDYLVQQIKECLLENDFLDEWTEVPYLLVWVLFMTGIASTATPERPWVVASLDRCLRRLDIHTWDKLRDVLQSFLWLPITNDKDGEALWREIESSSPLGGLVAS